MIRVAEHAARSDTGRQRRHNEDSFVARAPLFAVADGVGGAQAGEVASQAAAEVLGRGLPDGPGSVEQRLAAAVQEANRRIYALASGDEALSGMGTTLTALHVGADDVTLVHVGDSRCYRWRGGALDRLSTDHSLVEELVRQGRLSPQDAEHHPQRSIITRALGQADEVEVDARTISPRDGDVFLICSDGLTDLVPEDGVASVLAAEPQLTAAARALVDAANVAGGRDNITVVLLRIEQLAGPGDEPATQRTQVGGVPAVAPDAPGDAAADPTAATSPAPVAARAPLAARTPERPRRRRRMPRLGIGALLLAGVLVVLALGAYLASQTIYFVGSDGEGFVAIYRGVPYELPGGVALYHRDYVSGVSTAQLARPQRATIVAHRLRSRRDSDELVRQLELGSVSAR